MKTRANISENDLGGVYDVVIIGAGFSGTMVAVNLLRNALLPMRILLCDRTQAIGRGLAYGTTDSKHLLNVRADQMGALPEDVGHFYKWLQTHPDECERAGVKEVKGCAYMPRLLFGDYLQDILKTTMQAHPEFKVVNAAIHHVHRNEDKDYLLTTDKGITIQSRQVVLALGNFPPSIGKLYSRVDNPYSEEVWEELARPGDVLIIGTGLTSLDLVMTLAQRKKHGRIHMLSRHGVFPQVHAASAHYDHSIDPHNPPKTARALLHTVRAHVKDAATLGIDWRSVVDSLRPINQALWEALPEKEQHKFLHAIRPYWDTHRHRCAPEIMAVRDALIADGRICIHQGHILAIETLEDISLISFRKRGSSKIEELKVRQVVSCTGPQSDLRKLHDPLVDSLLKEGLVSPDRLKIGMATNSDYGVTDSDGTTNSGMYALGSLLKGRLYESVAVPELRVQAQEVSKQILSGCDK